MSKCKRDTQLFYGSADGLNEIPINSLEIESRGHVQWLQSRIKAFLEEN